MRESAKRFPNSLFIRARCFESIHAHDAVATWSKKAGWALCSETRWFYWISC